MYTVLFQIPTTSASKTQEGIVKKKYFNPGSGEHTIKFFTDRYPKTKVGTAFLSINHSTEVPNCDKFISRGIIKRFHSIKLIYRFNKSKQTCNATYFVAVYSKLTCTILENKQQIKWYHIRHTNFANGRD